MTAVPLINYVSGYSDTVDSGVNSDCDTNSVYYISSNRNNSPNILQQDPGINHHYDQFNLSDIHTFIDSTSRFSTNLKLPVVSLPPPEVRSTNNTNPLLDTCYQRAIARAKRRLLKGEILDKNGEWRLPGAPVPARPDYTKVKPTKDNSKYRRRQIKHQRSETYPQRALKDRNAYRSNYTNGIDNGFTNNTPVNSPSVPVPNHPAHSRVSEIDSDYIGRSYVQFTGTALLNPKYLSAVDIRTSNDDTRQLCYGCRSNDHGYSEAALSGIYGSLPDDQASHHISGCSVNAEVTIKHGADVIRDRSANSKNDYASKNRNIKTRRVGGGFLFYETEPKFGNSSLPKWVRLDEADKASNEAITVHVDKLQEPDGPVYAPTIPRDTRSPVPKFIRDRQIHGPEFAKPSIYETVMKYKNRKNESLTDGDSSVTSGLGMSINSEVLKRQKEEEEAEERLRAERTERQALEEKRKAEEDDEQRRKEELRKELYKAPKPFKLNAQDKNPTVPVDPFSKNRSFNIPKPKEIEIKKSTKPLTKPQDFERRDSNWNEPKKFELQKDNNKKTTEFWKAPVRTETTVPPKKKVNEEKSLSRSPVEEPKKRKETPEPVSELEESADEIQISSESSTSITPQPVFEDESDQSALESDDEKELKVVVEPEIETRDSSPTHDTPVATQNKKHVPNPSPMSIPTRRKQTPQEEPTDTLEHSLSPDSTKDSSSPSNKKSSPPPGEEPTPTPPGEPTPQSRQTPPSTKEPIDSTQKESIVKPPPLPQIEETNPIVVKPIKNPEEKLKLKRLMPAKNWKPSKIEKPKKSRDLKPKHLQKKKLKFDRKIELPVKRKEGLVKFPILHQSDPDPVPPEPPPKPEPVPIVLPPLPTIEQKEDSQPSPPRSPSPLQPKITARKEPIIWKRKIRKIKTKLNKPKQATKSSSPENIGRDPLDYLAKYCIVHKNRIGFYERVFNKFTLKSKNYEGDSFLNESFISDDVGQPSFTSLTSQFDEFQNTFGPTSDSIDADEYISPTDIAVEDQSVQKLTESPTSDLDSSPSSPRLGTNEDSIQLQHRLDKLSFIMDNVYSKIEKLHLQISEYQEQYQASVINLARAELKNNFRETIEVTKNHKSGKTIKKGKGKKSDKFNNGQPTVIVGASPAGTPRDTGSPVQLKMVDHLPNDEIIARTASVTMRKIERDPGVRKTKLAETRAKEKLADMEKWLSELKEEHSLVTSQTTEQKRREETNRAAANIEFRRAQSSLYKKMNPLEEHNVKMSDMQPLLKQINGQLITTKECQYVYHVLNLPQRHKLNFKLFTVVAALSEKVSRLEPFVKKMINKMDFEALDVKMQRAKELFQLLEDECDETYPGEVTIDSLSVELQAGGLSKENVQFVVNKFGREGNGIVDFLDYLTYLPLFIDIHGNIINDPLNHSVINV